MPDDAKITSGPEADKARKPNPFKQPNPFWPAVNDRASAEKAWKTGLAGAGAVLVLTVILALVALTGVLPGGVDYVYLVISLAAWIGLMVWYYFKSRIAAVALVVFYILNQGYAMAESGDPQTVRLIIVVLFAVMLITGVRGTFALAKQPG